MLSRCLTLMRPAVRVAAMPRSRHWLVPNEFQQFNRIVEDFFREPFLMPRMLPRMEPLTAPTGMRFFKEDGKLVAQMRLPPDVKPENVKIALKDGRLSVSVRSEVEQENFRSVKEFHEELKLDDNVVMMDKMEAFVDSNEGRLRIEAPLKKPDDDGKVRLSIDMNGGSSASGGGSRNNQ